LLRNPIDRAYSHYQHERHRGVEMLSFEDAIDRESMRLSGEDERMRQEPDYYSFNHHHFSYVARGMYADQLEGLYSFFPERKILVLISEHFFAAPEETYSKALAFLGLPPHSLSDYPTFNPGRQSDIDPRVRRRLAERFADANDRLARLLDISLPWD
jgi:hypothetical protein